MEDTELDCLIYENYYFYPKDMQKCCSCEHYLTCLDNYAQLKNERVSVYGNKNTIINFHKNGEIELVKYNGGFSNLIASAGKDDIPINHSRTYKYDEVKKILVPIKNTANLLSLTKNLHNSSKRAQDTFFGYALSSKWDYFLTLTFSKFYSDRYDDHNIKHLWKLFLQKLNYIDPQVKILSMAERHKDGALHFHCLARFAVEFPIVDYGNLSVYPVRKSKRGSKDGFCTFDETGVFIAPHNVTAKNYLVPYYEFGQVKYSSSGAMLFAFNFYDFGICSLAFVPQDDNQSQAVVNYLSKYTVKQCNIGYNQRRYYRTRNLPYKDKLVLLMSDDAVNSFLDEYSLVAYKSTNKMTIYRNFGLYQSTKLDYKIALERLKR